jgi:hypothetical protein
LNFWFTAFCWCPRTNLRSCSDRRPAEGFSSSRAIAKDCQLFSFVERRPATSGSLQLSATILLPIRSAWRLFGKQPFHGISERSCGGGFKKSRASA